MSAESKHLVHIGGVMRCCFEQDWPDNPNEGDILPCKYEEDGGFRFHNGRWQAKWMEVEG